jgi:putative transposase
MSQTYARLLYHIVFSTKERRPQIRPDLHLYLGGIIKRLGGLPFKIGGVEDHVHLLTSIPPTIAVSDFMRDLKAGSSKWAREREPGFEWQRGFAAFTVNQSIVDDVDRYIANQEQHHAKQDFIGELKRLLELNHVEFDPQYLE